MMSEQKQKQTEKSALPPFFFSSSSTSSSLYLINIHCIWSFFVFPGGHPRRRNHPSISADLFETHEGTHILQVREREKEKKEEEKKRKKKKEKKRKEALPSVSHPLLSFLNTASSDRLSCFIVLFLPVTDFFFFFFGFWFVDVFHFIIIITTSSSA